MFGWFKKRKTIVIDNIEDNVENAEFLSDSAEVQLQNTLTIEKQLLDAEPVDKPTNDSEKAAVSVMRANRAAYQYPSLDLLEKPTAIEANRDIEVTKKTLSATLMSFGININEITAIQCPFFMVFEFKPPQGIKFSRIKYLESEIALNTSASSVRVTQFYHRGTVGVEVSNSRIDTIPLSSVLCGTDFSATTKILPIVLGLNSFNQCSILDLAELPSLLIVGASGQGKSILLHSIILSLLFKKQPSELKFVLVDTKKVELSLYSRLNKYFLTSNHQSSEKIITSYDDALNVLTGLLSEINNRYNLLKAAACRNIKEYNQEMHSRAGTNTQQLPYIATIIDEFSDLLTGIGKSIEPVIEEIAKLGQAVGVHLIVATTPRTTIRGMSNINTEIFSSRIALKVFSKSDSIWALNCGEAEHLTEPGDMLLLHNNEIIRLQCPLIETYEIERVVNFISDQRYEVGEFTLPYPDDAIRTFDEIDLSNRDKLFDDCARVVVQMQSGSTANLQRRFNLGYNRAGRIMDQLEAVGIVGPASGSKPREVYFSTLVELDEFLSLL